MFLFMCSLWIWHEQLISLRQRQQKTGRLYNDLKKKKHNYWNRSELISVTGNRSVTWSDGGFTISILKIPFCPHHQIGKSWFSVVPVFCYLFWNNTFVPLQNTSISLETFCYLLTFDTPAARVSQCLRATILITVRILLVIKLQCWTCLFTVNSFVISTFWVTGAKMLKSLNVKKNTQWKKACWTTVYCLSPTPDLNSEEIVHSL